MTLTKVLGINPTLFLHFTFTLQIAGFPWRARKDSNLRPSLFVVRGVVFLTVAHGCRTGITKPSVRFRCCSMFRVVALG